jgi:hypothetical protein
MDTGLYDEFAEGYFLTAKAMAWFWDAYAPDIERRLEPYASPLRATDESSPTLDRAGRLVGALRSWRGSLLGGVRCCSGNRHRRWSVQRRWRHARLLRRECQLHSCQCGARRPGGELPCRGFDGERATRLRAAA